MTWPARPYSQACVPRSRAKSGGWHTVDGEAISRAGLLERAERAGGVLAKPARLLIRSVRQDAPLGRAGRLSVLWRNLALVGVTLLVQRRHNMEEEKKEDIKLDDAERTKCEIWTRRPEE